MSLLLKLDDEGKWQEVQYNIAHEKVSHALRSAKDRSKPAPKRTRNVVIKPPSEEEEHFFQVLATDQEQIFQDLLRKNKRPRR